MNKNLQLFEGQQVRTQWDKKNQKYWFSIIDIIAILTESSNPRHYWTVLKGRLAEEGNETVTNCERLKMLSPDNKMRLTDVADTEQVLRLIQSIPSKKAEPFKIWLAKVGNEFIDEVADPELAINRAVNNYRRLGYSENWINQRIKDIEVRKALTDEWDKSGVRQGREYAILTDLMYKTWAGMSTREYKEFKGLKKENLRDNMTNTELVLNMFAEVTATDISTDEKPSCLSESAEIARRGAEVAKGARELYEKQRGRSAISELNAKTFLQMSENSGQLESNKRRLNKKKS